jgi:hypothetical protein
MEAAQALADLLLASPQVEAAAVFDSDNALLGSLGVSDRSAGAAIQAGRTLLEDASGLRGVGEARQVHASLAGGAVFVVGRRSGPAILAVTAERHAPGLLFHALKRCLASVLEAQKSSRAEAGE